MTKYLLYYAGLDRLQKREQIGLAISEDLVSWQRIGQGPILPVGSSGKADAAQTSNPCVLKQGNLYRMWYQGKAADGRVSICYAESRDGFSWHADAAPLLSAPLEEAGTYRAGFHHPHVLFDASTKKYRMWYVRQREGRATIGYAESADGRAWPVLQDDILVPSEPWEGPYLYYPFVRKTSRGYEMWYTTRAPGRRWQLGRAVSEDGIAWQKDPKNPLLPRRMLPRIVRRMADILLGPLRFAAAKAVNGSSSAFLFEKGDRSLLLAHDAGIAGRLSIGLYEERENAWQVIERDILARGAGEWESYFQADPFLIEA